MLWLVIAACLYVAISYIFKWNINFIENAMKLTGVKVESKSLEVKDHG